MQSKELDKVSIKDTYETSAGDKKTRTITVRSMVNQGSMFANIHLGRGSVNIPKDKVGKVAKALKSLDWKDSKESDEIAELKAKIKELEKKK